MVYRRYYLSNSILNILNSSLSDILDPFRSKDWTKQFCAGEFDQFNNQTNYCMGKMIYYAYI